MRTKMKKKNILVTIPIMMIAFVFLSSCKREGVTEPSLLTPSSFVNLLKLNLSTNTIAAGEQARESITITATLKKFDGTSIPNKNVYFEIVEAAGNKASLGFFEGNESTKIRTTDSTGTIRLNYYGPVIDDFVELILADADVDGDGFNDTLYSLLNDQNTTLYIKASIGWEGAEQISEIAQFNIIVPDNLVSLLLRASPDVLYAAEGQPESMITARLLVGGIPVPGVKIYFLIADNGPGVFSDGLKATSSITDSDGVAMITYKGPLGSEISGDQLVWIRAQLTENYFVKIPLRLIKKR